MKYFNRRQFMEILSLIPAALMGLPGLLLGQRQPANRQNTGRGPARAAATPPNPIVTVTKTDATVLRGQILAVDVERISFKPALRAGERGDPPPIDIPWKQIKTVSNGMTYQKTLAEWKQAHRNDLCTTCRGNRVVPCSVCKGTSHNPAGLPSDCPACKGALLVECKVPKCEDGKAPCPSTCLKLSEGTWTTKPDGKRWRRFNVAGGGWVEWSDAHVGELIVAENGKPTSKGTCPTCNRATVVECASCRGMGKSPCPTCTSLKDAPACTNKCEQGYNECPSCKGKGLKVA